MTIWRYKLSFFAQRFALFAICNFFDAFILFQGVGLRTQTALIIFYRWVLYTPQSRDLLIIVLHTQKRYLQVSHQYLRWLIFLGVLILANQIEYALHLLLDQQIVFSFMLILSILCTFSLYPFIFKFLQHYDQ